MTYWSRFKQSWRQTSNWNKLMVTLTAVVAASTTVYTHYAKKQFVTMDGQLAEMRSASKQTDQLIGLYQQQLVELRQQEADTHELAVQAKNQADRTRELADRALMANDISRKTAEAAGVAANVAQQQLENSARPWVGLDELVLDSPIDVSGKVPLEARSTEVFKNFGQSPALRVVQTPGIATTERELDRDFPKTCTGARETADENPYLPPSGLPRDVLFPGKEIRSHYVRGQPADIKFPVRELFIFGCIAYRDQFHTWHQTRYCFTTPVALTDQPVQSVPFACTRYNDAD